MRKSLTIVGNSKALIIPATLIKKYELDQIILEETEEGLLIKSATKIDSFQKKVEKLRRNLSLISRRMKEQANHPDTIKYYSDPENIFSEVDVDIVEGL